MKIIARFDNGYETELKEIQGLNKDCEVVIVKSNGMFSPLDLKKMEDQLSEKLNRKVVVLDARYQGILGTI